MAGYVVFCSFKLEAAY